MKSISTEQEILSRPGDWSFDYHVSKIFDDHVRKSIPCYDVIQKLIAKISQKYLPEKAIVYDLGTATGEVIYNIDKANRSKNITYIGIDISYPMLERAMEKCSDITDVTFYNNSIEEINFLHSDLIVSAFTLQFVDIEKRKQICQNIKNSLKSSGLFILCEKLAFDNDRISDLFITLHEDWKLNFFSNEEISLKRNSLKKVMRLLTFSDYYKMLREVGFKQINLFFQWCNFVCILVS